MSLISAFSLWSLPEKEIVKEWYPKHFKIFRDISIFYWERNASTWKTYQITCGGPYL